MKKISLFYLTVLTLIGFMLPMMAGHVLATDFVQDAQCQATDKKQCIAAPTQAPDQVYCAKNNCDLVAKYINPLIKFIGIVVGLAVTIGIIYGGIQYSSSAGDPQKSAAGKRHIVQAVIGLIAYFFLYALLRFLMPAITV